MRHRLHKLLINQKGIRTPCLVGRSPESRLRRVAEEATTLVELMVVLACFSIIAIAIYAISSQTQLFNDNLNAWNNLTQWGQTAANQINLELTQGRIIYQNDALGTDYQSKLQMDAAYPVTTTTLLPVIDSTGTFHQDTVTTTRTGNALMFVKDCVPYVGNTVTDTRRVDIYQLVYYYLSPSNKPISGKTQSLRLVRWVSKEFADYNQVMAIPAGAPRDTFVINMYTNRLISHLWIPHNTPATAFYGISLGGVIDGVPDPTYTIEKATVESFIPSMGLGYASIAWNRSTEFWTPDPVPKFAQASSTGSGFPHGFEVQIIGPSGGRQALIRLVLAYYIPLNKSLYSSETITIVALREY